MKIDFEWKPITEIPTEHWEKMYQCWVTPHINFMRMMMALHLKALNG